MRLSKEVTILSRIVDIVCWDEGEQKVGGQGSRTNKYSIDFLARQHILTNLDSTWARTVRCDWAREDWRTDEGIVGQLINQEAVDNILFMADQYIGGPEDGILEADENVTGLQVWIDALEFLHEIGAVTIVERQIALIPSEKLDRLIRTGRESPLPDRHTYPTIKAHIIDPGHMNRRYSPDYLPTD